MERDTKLLSLLNKGTRRGIDSTNFNKPTLKEPSLNIFQTKPTTILTDCIAEIFGYTTLTTLCKVSGN